MGRERKVSIYVCYPVEFGKNVDGDWAWNYVGNATNPVTKVINVKKSVSFHELYEVVKEELEIDTCLNDFELKFMAPVSKAAPIVVDCDKVVKRFFSVCDVKKDMILVSLKAKENGTQFQGEATHVEPDASRVHHDEHAMESQETRELLYLMGTQASSVEMDVDENDEVNERTDGMWIEEGLDSRENVEMPNDPLLMSLGEDVFLQHEDPMNLDYPNGDGMNAAHNVESLNATEPGTGIDIEGVDVVNIPEDVDIHVKDKFSSKEYLQYKVEFLAVKFKFIIKTMKSTTTLFTSKCAANGCKWRLRATKSRGCEQFEVTKYEVKHTCRPLIALKDHKNASYKLIGRHYAWKFKDPNRVIPPRDIVNDFFQEFGYEINYDKALDAKKHAETIIRGNPKTSYGHLHKYFHALKLANPGTLTEIETKPNKEFLYLFMALGSSIEGYKWMRKVISVDGTHLKTSYEGVLLVATCQDGNGQIFPIAWGVVDSENTASWTWFFERLKSITGDTEDLAILSDRHDAIKAAFGTVFVNAHQGFCTYHMQKNLRSRYRGCNVSDLFHNASRAYTVAEFNRKWNIMTEKVKKDIKEYLNESTFPYWARCHFPGERYNIMTTNHAESLNGLLKRPREFSVIGLIEFIRALLQRWQAERSKLASKCGAAVTPSVDVEIKKHYEKVNNYLVSLISDCEQKYQVYDNVGHLTYIVNLDERKCSCKCFDLDKYPCVHAVVVAKNIGRHATDYTSAYYSTDYWKKAYAKCVYPLSNSGDVDYPEDVLSKVVLPPVPKKRPPGRPSKKRKPSAGDGKRIIRCGKCKQTGHNVTTCSRLTTQETDTTETYTESEFIPVHWLI